jgi:hypothetical protein
MLQRQTVRRWKVYFKRLAMTKIDWLARLLHKLPAGNAVRRNAGRGGVALLLMTGIAVAQSPAADAPVVQNHYVIRQTADLGGHIVGVSGSGSMYDTLVNLHSGPRVLGQTYTMTPVAGSKHPLLDNLSAMSGGFGGDPNNFAKLDFSKGKLYEFNGIFRRDRQYFDYDLLGNPSIPSGLSIPIGPSTAPTGLLAWQQQRQSPVMFNTVRRMTDTGLTLLPLSKVTFRVGYSQNIFQGPTLSPGRSIGKYDSLLAEYQRNSTDDFLGAIDWKPWQLTRITFEEQVDHYKADSYFTLAPSELTVQEADGTPASLGNWDIASTPATPYPIASCNTGSMGSAYTNSTTYTILSAPQTPGGRPIINAACDVITSYLRSQPTRTIYPTELLRFQSSSIRNIQTNGDVRYSVGNSTMPHYYENFQGLDGAIRSATFTGSTVAQRRMVSIDYGLTWQATKTIGLSDQVNFSNLHQPGNANITPGITQNAPTTAGNETINYAGALLSGANYTVSGNPTGAVPLYAYFGQKFLTNNATVSWEASSRATLSLTYRYQAHTIIQTSGTGPASNLIGIDENGGILNAAYRPTSNWKMNGSVEIAYADNALTPIGARQTKRYRFHTTYKPRPWATVSGSYNDLERHNNTNNTGTPSADGPLGHVDHNRNVSLDVVLAPNEHYSFDVNYAYMDVYTSTNICYFSGASATLAGAASGSTGKPNLCPSVLTDWGPVKDFMDAPTQYASINATYSPNKVFWSSMGYRISAVSGNQFFADAQQVNGSLQSAYQTPYVNIAWTVHPGLIWQAEYNYYGYGEGGPSGAPLCSTSTGASAVVVPCNTTTLAGPTGLTEPSSGLTAPRNFHGNVVTLAIHYEF